MKYFNAFQIVSAFVAFPFFIAWLPSQEAFWARPVFVAACVVYLFGFAFMVAFVAEELGKNN